MDESFEDEEKIVWLKSREDLARMGYVREKILLCKIRTGPVKPPEDETLVGYVVLKKTAQRSEENGFYRRVFTLQPIDRYYQPDGPFRNSAPLEAVDPLSVHAGGASPKLARISKE